MRAESKPPAAAAPPGGDPPDPTGMSTMRLDGPIPGSWQDWRQIHFGPTLIDLREAMETEASRATFWPQSEMAIAEARTAREESPSWPTDSSLDCARIQQATQERDQALRLGYALAMTRKFARAGPETWYKAALAYAAITLMSDAESKAIYHHLDALYEAAAERCGWI
jgi:hypothetical protein